MADDPREDVPLTPTEAQEEMEATQYWADIAILTEEYKRLFAEKWRKTEDPGATFPSLSFKKDIHDKIIKQSREEAESNPKDPYAVKEVKFQEALTKRWMAVYGVEEAIAKIKVAETRGTGKPEKLTQKLLKINTNTILSDMQNILSQPERRREFAASLDASLQRHVVLHDRTLLIDPDKPESARLRPILQEAKERNELAKLLTKSGKTPGPIELYGMYQKKAEVKLDVLENIGPTDQKDAQAMLRRVNDLIDYRDMRSDEWFNAYKSMLENREDETASDRVNMFATQIKEANAELAGLTKLLGQMAGDMPFDLPTKKREDLNEKIDKYFATPSSFKGDMAPLALVPRGGVPAYLEVKKGFQDRAKEIIPKNWSKSDVPEIDMHYVKVFQKYGRELGVPSDRPMTRKERATSAVVEQYRQRIEELDKLSPNQGGQGLTLEQIRERDKARKIVETYEVPVYSDFEKYKDIAITQLTVPLSLTFDVAMGEQLGTTRKQLQDLGSELLDSALAFTPEEATEMLDSLSLSGKEVPEWQSEYTKKLEEEYTARRFASQLTDATAKVFDHPKMEDYIFASDNLNDLLNIREFADLKVEELPKYLFDRISPSNKAGESVSIDDIKGLTLSQLNDQYQIQLELYDFKNYAEMRKQELKGLPKLFAEGLMEYGMNPTYDPTTGVITYKPSHLLVGIDLLSSSVPRAIMEFPLSVVSPAYWDWTLQQISTHSSFEYQGIRDFDNTTYLNRIVAHLVSDPGAMGSFSELAAASGYSEYSKEYQATKWFGIGLDFLIPWERLGGNTIGMGFRVGARTVKGAGYTGKIRPDLLGGDKTLPYISKHARPWANMEWGWKQKAYWSLTGGADFKINFADFAMFFPASVVRNDTGFTTVNVTKFWHKYAKKDFDKERRWRAVLGGEIKASDYMAIAYYESVLRKVAKGEDPFAYNVDDIKNQEYANHLKDKAELMRNRVVNHISQLTELTPQEVKDLLYKKMAESRVRTLELSEYLAAESGKQPEWVSNLKQDHDYNVTFVKTLQKQADVGEFLPEEVSIIKTLSWKLAEKMFPEDPGKFYQIQRYIVDSDIEFKDSTKPRKTIAQIADDTLRVPDKNVTEEDIALAKLQFESVVEEFPVTKKELKDHGVNAMMETSAKSAAGVPADTKLQKILDVKLDSETNETQMKLVSPRALAPRYLKRGEKTPTAQSFLEKLPEEKRGEYAKKILIDQEIKDAKTIVYASKKDLDTDNSFVTITEEKVKITLDDKELVTDQKQIMVQSMFGGWVESMAELEPTTSMFKDLFHRKQIAYSLLNMARKNGKHGVTFRLGQNGIFKQFYGEGRSLDIETIRPGEAKKIEALDEAFIAALRAYNEDIQVITVEGKKLVHVPLQPSFLEIRNNKAKSIIKLRPEIPRNIPEYVGEGIGPDVPTPEHISVTIEPDVFASMIEAYGADINELAEIVSGDVTTPTTGLQIKESINYNQGRYDIGPEDNPITIHGEFVNNAPMAARDKPSIGYVIKDLEGINAPNSSHQNAEITELLNEYATLSQKEPSKLKKERAKKLKKVEKAGETAIQKLTEKFNKKNTPIETKLKELKTEVFEIEKEVDEKLSDLMDETDDVRAKELNDDIASGTKDIKHIEKKIEKLEKEKQDLRNTFQTELEEIQQSIDTEKENSGRVERIVEEAMKLRQDKIKKQIHEKEQKIGFVEISPEPDQELIKSLNNEKEQLQLALEMKEEERMAEIRRMLHEQQFNQALPDGVQFASFANSVYANSVGVPRRTIRQLLKTIIQRHNVSAIGWPMDNPLLGKAIELELQAAGIQHRIRLAQMEEGQSVHPYIEINAGTASEISQFNYITDPTLENLNINDIEIARWKKSPELRRWMSRNDRPRVAARRISPRIEESPFLEIDGYTYNDLQDIIKDLNREIENTKSDGTYERKLKQRFNKKLDKLQSKEDIQTDVINDETNRYVQSQEGLKTRHTSLIEQRDKLQAQLAKIPASPSVVPWYGRINIRQKAKQNRFIRMDILVHDLVNRMDLEKEGLIKINDAWHMPFEVFVANDNLQIQKQNILNIKSMGPRLASHVDLLEPNVVYSIWSRLTRMAAAEGFWGIGLNKTQEPKLRRLYQKYEEGLNELNNAWDKAHENDLLRDYFLSAGKVHHVTPDDPHYVKALRKLAVTSPIAKEFIDEYLPQVNQALDDLVLKEIPDLTREDAQSLVDEISEMKSYAYRIKRGELKISTEELLDNHKQILTDIRKEISEAPWEEKKTIIQKWITKLDKAYPEKGTIEERFEYTIQNRKAKHKTSAGIYTPIIKKLKTITSTITSYQGPIKALNEALHENPKYRPLNHQLNINVIRDGGRLFGTTSVLKISDAMRDSIGSKAPRTTVYDNKSNIAIDDGYIVDTRQNDGINFQHIIYALEKNKTGVKVDTQFATYKLDIGEMPEGVDPQEVFNRLVEVDAQINIGNDPLAILDSAVLADLQSKYDDNHLRAYIQHLYNEEAITEYANELRELGFNIQQYPTTYTDGNFRSISDQDAIKYFRGITKPETFRTQSQAPETAPGLIDVYEHTGKIRRTRHGITFADISPRLMIDIGMTEYDIHALRSKVGIKALADELETRLNKILNGEVSDAELLKYSILEHARATSKEPNLGSVFNRIVNEPDIILGKGVTLQSERSLAQYLGLFFETIEGQEVLNSPEKYSHRIEFITEMFSEKVQADFAAGFDELEVSLLLKSSQDIRNELKEGVHSQQAKRFIRGYLNISDDIKDFNDIEIDTFLLPEEIVDELILTRPKDQLLTRFLNRVIESPIEFEASRKAILTQQTRKPGGLARARSFVISRELDSEIIDSRPRAGKRKFEFNDIDIEKFKTGINIGTFEANGRIKYKATFAQNPTPRNFLLAQAHIILSFFDEETITHLTKYFDSIPGENGRLKLSAKGLRDFADQYANLIEYAKMTPAMAKADILKTRGDFFQLWDRMKTSFARESILGESDYFQPTPTYLDASRPRPIAKRMIPLFDAILRPQSYKIDEAAQTVRLEGSNTQPIKIRRQALAEERTAAPPIRAGEVKKQQEMSSVQRKQLLQDLGNPIFNSKPQNFELDAEGNLVYVQRGLNEGDEIDIFELTARLTALVQKREMMGENSVFTLAERMGDPLVPVTGRTIIPTSKMKTYQDSIKRNLETVIGESIEDFSLKFQNVEGVFKDSAVTYMETRANLTPEQATRISQLAKHILSEPMGAGNIPEQIADMNLFRDRFVTTGSYYITTEEYNSINRAMLDTMAPIGARRSKVAEAIPTSLLGALSKSLVGLLTRQNTIAGARGTGKFITELKRLQQEYFTSEIPGEKELDPGLVEVLQEYLRSLNNLVDDLNQDAIQISEALRMGSINDDMIRFETMGKLKDLLVPPVRTDNVPELLQLNTRMRATREELITPQEKLKGMTGGEKFTVQDMVDEEILNRIENLFTVNGVGISQLEFNAIQILRNPALIEAANKGELASPQINAIQSAFHTLSSGLDRRKHSFEIRADKIIKSLVGIELKPEMDPKTIQRIRSRAYTLFYEGKWSPIHREPKQKYTMENVPAGGYTIENMIDLARNQGYGLPESTDAQIAGQIDAQLKDLAQDLVFDGKSITAEKLVAGKIADEDIDQAVIKVLNAINQVKAQIFQDDLSNLVDSIGGGRSPYAADITQRRTDPLAQIGEMIINLRGLQLQENLAKKIFSLGYGVDIDKYLQKFQNHGLNPLTEQESFTVAVYQTLSDLLDYSYNQVVDHNNQPLRGNRAQTSPESDPVSFYAQQAAYEILENLGLSRRGIMNQDKVELYKFPDGSSMYLPSAVKATIDDTIENIMGVGKAVGNVETDQFLHMIREYDYVKMTKGKGELHIDNLEDATKKRNIIKKLWNWRNDYKQKEKLGAQKLSEKGMAGLVKIYFETLFKKPVNVLPSITAISAGITAASIGVGWPAGLALLLGGYLEQSSRLKAAFGEEYFNKLKQTQTKLENAYLEQVGNLNDIDVEKTLTEAGVELDAAIAKRRKYNQEFMEKTVQFKRKKIREKIPEDKQHLIPPNLETMSPESLKIFVEMMDEKHNIKIKNTEQDIMDFMLMTKKSVGASVSQFFAQILLNPVDAFKNATSMKKMDVTVGIGAPTAAYYSGNYNGAALQMFYHRGMNPHLIGMGVGGVAAATAMGASTGFALPGLMLGAAAGAMVLPGVYGKIFGGSKESLQALSFQIPSIMALLHGGHRGKINTSVRNSFGENKHFRVAPIVTRHGEILSVYDIADEMKKFGAGTSYLKAETSALFAQNVRDMFPTLTKRLVNILGGKAVAKLFIDVAEAQDNFYRTGLFIELRKEGHSPASAAKEVRTAMFDYADLSEFEKNTLRQIFLFYAFMRKNMGMMATALIQNPHRVLGFNRLRRDLQRDAYNTAEPEIATSNWTIPRPPWSFLSQKVDVSGTPTIFSNLYEEFAVLNPPVNDWDSMQLMMSFYGLITTNKTSEAAESILSGINPLFQYPITALYGSTIFGQKKLEHQRIEPHVIRLSNMLGGALFNTTEGGNGLINIKLNKPDPSEMNRERAARLALAGDHPFLDFGHYSPATEEDGLKWWMVNEVVAPIITGRVPFLYWFGPFFGRGAKQVSKLDRMDVSKGFAEWQQCNQSAMWLCSALAGEDVSNMSKDNFQTWFESQGIGSKEEGGTFFDLLIKPPGVPRGSLFADFLGYRLQPVRKSQAIYQNLLNDYERKLRKQ